MPGNTPKGERESRRILDAAIEVLARDGLSDLTLQGVADQAGVVKRMVVYYFGSRDELLARIVADVGDRVAATVAEALDAVTEPAPLADIGLDALWSAGLAAPALPRAYFALLHGTNDPEIRAALRSITERFYALAHERIAALESQGYRLTGERDAFITLTFAAVRGLVVEWAETGETPAVEAALQELKAYVASRFEPTG